MYDTTPSETRTSKYNLIYYLLFILLVQLCLAFITYQILKNEYVNDREQCVTETKFEEALRKAIESGFDEDFLNYVQSKRSASSEETALFDFLEGGTVKVKRDLGPRPSTPGFPGPRGPPSPTDYPGLPGSRGGRGGSSVNH